MGHLQGWLGAGAGPEGRLKTFCVTAAREWDAQMPGSGDPGDGSGLPKAGETMWEQEAGDPAAPQLTASAPQPHLPGTHVCLDF